MPQLQAPAAAQPTGGTVILLDVSGSMAEMTGAKRRIDVLTEALLTVRAPGVRMFGFHSVCSELEPDGAVPEPRGGTNLGGAIEHITQLRPTRLVVIGDGLPDNEEHALAAARALHADIATIFVGNDGDAVGRAFMRRLAWCAADGLGSSSTVNLRKALAAETALRLALTGPRT